MIEHENRSMREPNRRTNAQLAKASAARPKPASRDEHRSLRPSRNNRPQGNEDPHARKTMTQNQLTPQAERPNGRRIAIQAKIDSDALKPFAKRYIWWKTPDEAVAMPEHVIAQVMNIGDYDDVQALCALIGDNVLRGVLTHAEIGQFNERSWTYWHYRLGLAAPEHVPPMPIRSLP